MALGDVCEYDRTQGVHRGLPYVGMEHIEAQTGRFIGSLDPVTVKSNTFRFTRKHVLYGRLRPYLNKVLTPDFEGHCSTEIFPLLPKPTLSRDFLRYWLMSDDIVNRINDTSTGARMPRANMDAVLQFGLPVPPLPEQQRIVAILDEAFAAIATAKANAEKNLQNARAVFENHLQFVFAQQGDGWVAKRLGDLAAFRNGINYTQSSRGDSVRIVGVKDFQKNYWAPLDNLDSVTIDGHLSDTDTLQEGDILTVRSNGNIELIGRTLLVGPVSEQVSHSGFTIRIRLNNGSVAPQFLCHFLKSNSARRRMIDGGIGTNIKSLNQMILGALDVPLPSLAVQTQIVNAINALSAKSQRLESIYQRKLAALDALKKSLLHHAFTGQPTARAAPAGIL